MKPGSRPPHRRSIRLAGYDYSQAGAYFVTIVAAARRCLFGKIVGDEMVVSAVGNIVLEEWGDLPRRFDFLDLGAFVVMPNHLHGIIVIRPPVGTTRPARNLIGAGDVPSPSATIAVPEGSPLREPALQRRSLGAIIAQFKPRVTKRTWKLPQMLGIPIWQRNYYDTSSAMRKSGTVSIAISNPIPPHGRRMRKTPHYNYRGRYAPRVNVQCL